MNNFISRNAIRIRTGVHMATLTENVSEEVQNEEIVSPPAEQEAQSQDTQQPSPESSEENSKEYNFKQLREVNKQLEIRLEKYEARLEGVETSSKSSSSQAENKAEEDLEIGEEELVEGRHLKKALSRIEKILYQKELEAIPDKLRGKYEDFDQVVTKENLEKLNETEPELYRTIRSGNDLYAKGVAAYKTLKGLGYIPEDENLMKQKDHVQNNHKKPLSTQAIRGSGALHEANIFANGLTPDLKKQLQKEMAEAAKAR